MIHVSHLLVLSAPQFVRSRLCSAYTAQGHRRCPVGRVQARAD
jgi:hypothetical protein